MNIDEFLAIFSSMEADNEYDKCWYFGRYTDQYCPCCPYRDECSGYDDEE